MFLLCWRAMAQSQGAWQAVGQIGGPTEAVAVAERRAYVGVGLRMAVLDVSDPARPRQIGVTPPLPHFVEDIAVRGTLACVAAAGAGLRVIDVSDPSRPVEVGAWDTRGYAEGVAVSGNTAYIADGPYGLRIFDVSEPSQPVEIGAAFVTNYAYKVAVEGRYAYIAAGGAGLLIADVADPAHPIELGFFDTSGYAYDVAVQQQVAYIADGWQGVKIVNGKNPTHPVQTAAYPTAGLALGVTLSGARLYVAGGFAGLRILDVGDPSNPVEVQQLDPGDGCARAVAVDGSVVYIADRDRGVRVVSLAGSAPTQLGLYCPLGYARAVAAAGNYAYVAAGFYGFRILDVSDAANPREVGGSYDVPGFVNNVSIVGHYAYVLVGTSLQGSIWIFDVSDPAKPTVVSTQQVHGARDMAVEQGTAYVAAESFVDIVDVSDPLHPSLASSLPTDGTAVGVAAAGKTAYIASSERGLKILDVSNPRDPKVAGAYQTEGNFSQEVSVFESRAYIADYTGLRILDVSDAAHPRELSYLSLPGTAYGVGVSRSVRRTPIGRPRILPDLHSPVEVYVAGGAAGLNVVYASVRTHPVLLDTIPAPGFGHKAVPADGRVYVADGPNGLLIVESGRAAGRASKAGLMMQSAFNDRRPEPSKTEPAVIESRSRRAASAASGVCVVTSTADDGDGTLRRCMQALASGGGSVGFDPAVFPPSRPATIFPVTALPGLSGGALIIDASNAGVILDGSRSPAGARGFDISSDGNVIRGLQITRWPFAAVFIRDGARNNVIGGDRGKGSGPTGEGNVISLNPTFALVIAAEGTADNVITGNLIGTDATGTVAAGNSNDGISVWSGVVRTRIGGSIPGECNILSGNGGAGLTFQGNTSDNVVTGNFIGTDISGAKALPNGMGGIALMAGPARNRIGGVNSTERNLISGNRGPGINLQGYDTNANSILGNFIGTDSLGEASVPNSALGSIIICGGAWNNLVQGNLLSGNAGWGIAIDDPHSSFNVITGNLIGSDVTGTAALPNDATAIYVGNGSYNRIGGTAMGEGNLIIGTIAFTGPAATRTLVLGNRIGVDITGARGLSNGSSGVQLGGNTRTLVGGATATEANIIAGGRFTVEAGSDYNYVGGNWIGTNSGAETKLGDPISAVDIRGEHNVIQGNVIAYSGTGVTLDPNVANTVRRNSIFGNVGLGIDFNQMPLPGYVPAPVLSAVTSNSVTGTACASCEVEIFSDTGNEGRYFEGSVVANGTGMFSFAKTSPFTALNVTATATDLAGGTSGFAAARVVPRQAVGFW